MTTLNTNVNAAPTIVDEAYGPECPHCHTAVPARARACTGCGAVKSTRGFGNTPTDQWARLFCWAPTVGTSLCFALWETKRQYEEVADVLNRSFRFDQLFTLFFSAFMVVAGWAVFWGVNKLWKKLLGSSGDPIWRRQL